MEKISVLPQWVKSFLLRVPGSGASRPQSSIRDQYGRVQSLNQKESQSRSRQRSVSGSSNKYSQGGFMSTKGSYERSNSKFRRGADDYWRMN